MGSSGRDYLGDYDFARRHKSSGDIGLGSGAGDVSGSSPGNVSNVIVIDLEDVATSDYYLTRHSVPAPESSVYVLNDLHDKRMVVCDSVCSEVIGNIPTQYQLQLSGALAGKSYLGKVISSGEFPIPRIKVAINA